MFYDTKINYEKTLEFYRYTKDEINSFTYGSKNKIVVECENCHRLIHKEFRNIKCKHQCPVVNGNTKKCFRCGETKDLSMFNKAPKQSGGVSKMCRSCYNNHPSVKRCEYDRKSRIKHSLHSDISLYIRKRLFGIKCRCKKNEIPYNLDANYMEELWNNQNSKCYYTGLIMDDSMKTLGFQSWNSPSVDRKNPSLGYVQGNVVWCIFGVNSFKQSLTETEFEFYLKNIVWWFGKNKLS